MSGRSYRRRWRNLTLEELKRISAESYLVAKCDIETTSQLYPCRPSEIRVRKWKSDPPGMKRTHEYPNMDESTWKYPIGLFTTWLRTSEIRELLDDGKIIKAHEAIITFPNAEHKAKWDKLRKEAFTFYGEHCMRCGDSKKTLEIDHVKKWSSHPASRYDITNLQVLCVECHRWKTEQENKDVPSQDIDFRSEQ